MHGMCVWPGNRFRHCLVVFLVFAAGCSPVHNIRTGSPATLSTGGVRILTYNIRIGAGLREYGRNPYLLKDELAPDIQPVIDAIRSVHPDIIGLQEVLGESQAAAIARGLNMNYVYVPHGWERYGSWWGLALLSSFPLQDGWGRQISEGPGNTRSNLFARIDISGTTWCFIVMHKDKDQRDGAALRSTMAAVQSITEPVVLLGDLNIRPRESRMTILAPRFQDSLEPCRSEPVTKAGVAHTGTLTGRRCRGGVKRIDYIFLDRDRFKVYDCGLIASEHWPASDHIGYFATIDLR